MYKFRQTLTQLWENGWTTAWYIPETGETLCKCHRDESSRTLFPSAVAGSLILRDIIHAILPVRGSGGRTLVGMDCLWFGCFGSLYNEKRLSGFTCWRFGNCCLLFARPFTSFQLVLSVKQKNNVSLKSCTECKTYVFLYPREFTTLSMSHTQTQF